MIKMTYKYEQYDYENIGHQPYDIKTELVVKNDATASEIVETVVELMKIAGYKSNSVYKALQKVAENIEDF